MRALTWARERFREKGLIDTVKVAVSVVLDSTFDWRYGTSTSGKVNSDQLGVTGGNQIHAKRYGATKVRPLLALLKSQDVPVNGVFVDFGSGKGRALMVAALYGFRRIVGVEFSPQLHEAAAAMSRSSWAEPVCPRRSISCSATWPRTPSQRIRTSSTCTTRSTTS